MRQPEEAASPSALSPGADLRLEGVSREFRLRGDRPGQRRVLRAVNNVDLRADAGKTLGIVGESGCGKSTLARIAVGLHKPSTGRVVLGVQDIHDKTAAGKEARRNLQMVFQNPSASLDPRFTIGRSVAEPLGARTTDVRTTVLAMLETVGLEQDMLDRYPNQLSGGQQQRVCIARALVAQPRVLVLDEAVSALDLSLQAQVINLLRRLQRQFHLTYVFIAHDLAVVHAISDRIAVMYLGDVVELADAAELQAAPLHPYTVALHSAVPIADPVIERQREQVILRGSVPSPIDPPAGCKFHTRCPIARDVCGTEAPSLVEVGNGRSVACHFPGEFRLGEAAAAATFRSATC